MKTQLIRATAKKWFGRLFWSTRPDKNKNVEETMPKNKSVKPETVIQVIPVQGKRKKKKDLQPVDIELKKKKAKPEAEPENENENENEPEAEEKSTPDGMTLKPVAKCDNPFQARKASPFTPRRQPITGGRMPRITPKRPRIKR